MRIKILESIIPRGHFSQMHHCIIEDMFTRMYQEVKDKNETHVYLVENNSSNNFTMFGNNNFLAIQYAKNIPDLSSKFRIITDISELRDMRFQPTVCIFITKPNIYKKLDQLQKAVRQINLYNRSAL